MCKIYLIFAQDWKDYGDFSESSAVELYNHESYGTSISSKNGYLIGKKYMDVTVKMWNEDIEKGILFKFELYNDEKFPHWWLDRVLK